MQWHQNELSSARSLQHRSQQPEKVGFSKHYIQKHPKCPFSITQLRNLHFAIFMADGINQTSSLYALCVMPVAGSICRPPGQFLSFFQERFFWNGGYEFRCTDIQPTLLCFCGADWHFFQKQKFVLEEYVCMYRHINIYVYTHIYTYIYVCMYIFTYMYVHIHIYTWILYIYLYICIHIEIFMYICIYIYASIHTWMHTCMHTQVHFSAV